MGLHVEHADPNNVHSSSSEVFAHVCVVVVTLVSRSLLLVELLLAGALAKTNFTKHVGEGQVLVGNTPHVGACNLVDVRTNRVATYHDC